MSGAVVSDCINEEHKNLEINKKQFQEPFQHEEKLKSLLERKSDWQCVFR